MQPAVNTKNETNVPELYVKPITQHPVLCAGGSSKTSGSSNPPLSARRGLPGWLQPASSTSPWLFYQVSSEVFSKSSSVMSSLLLLQTNRVQKTRVRHKQAQVQNSQQNEFKRQAQGAGASRGGAGPEPLQPAVKHKKIRQTFRSCLSSLTRSCIQDCVQEVPVGPMAQGTPPSAHAAAFQGGFNRLHQLLHGFFTKSQVKSFQNHLPS